MDLLPVPGEVLRSFFDFLSGGDFLSHVVPSFLRVTVALAISAAIGIPVGLVAARRNLPGKTTSGMVSAIRYLPPTAFIGLLILGFGIGPQTAIALMIIGVAPYVAIMSADAFKSVPADHVEVARAFGASGAEVFAKVIWPYVTPRLIDAVKVNVGAAWTFLVAAEIIAGNSGLGFLIANAQRYANVQDLYALLLICGACGLLMDRILDTFSRYMGRWARYAFD
jgi:NitT/TauT family transport system permease protein